MHVPLAFGACALLGVSGWLLSTVPAAPARSGSGAPTNESPPVASGHYALVVEGDRNGLAITHARRKTDPWAGVPKGFDSEWRLVVRDDRGETLADLPLDVSMFATEARAAGQPARVVGCVVRDPRIAMLVNVPRFPNAATYTFTRPDGEGGAATIGVTSGAGVRTLAEEQ